MGRQTGKPRRIRVHARSSRGLPEGLTVVEKPMKLDDALLGMVILMRWAAPHGWAVGKISNQITASTPRLFKNFNYRCTWTDGWTNTLLKLDEYKGGASAPYGSRGFFSKRLHLQLGLRHAGVNSCKQGGCAVLQLRQGLRSNVRTVLAHCVPTLLQKGVGTF